MQCDPARVRRALSLHVEQLGDGVFRVSGGREPHSVTTSELPWECDCRDAAYRHDVRCKHTTAVYLAQRLHPSVRDALRRATEPEKENIQ